MSFDLDRKEFDEAIKEKRFDWLWSAYCDLQKQIEQLENELRYSSGCCCPNVAFKGHDSMCELEREG